MEYRINRRTGDQISILGLGSGSSGFATHAPFDEMVRMLEYAFEQGINFYDLCCGTWICYEAYAAAHGGVRDQVHYQVHFGIDYSTGRYGWTTELDAIKRSIEKELKALKTDYIDYGFIHCIDEDSDLKQYIDNGVLDYIQSLKAQGVVKHIGLSSHSPAFVHKIMDRDLIDMLMFSINAAYDYKMGGKLAYGESDERDVMYRRCVKEGVGISVMKVFAGGQLLSAEQSPFGRALTNYQCMQYVLDRPGVLTLVPGIKSLSELKNYLGFLEASADEKDYSVLAECSPAAVQGKCVYCEHCQPCPAELDIALINKYYDLSRAGDAIAHDHYMHLEKKADDCAQCGHCNDRCPFHIDQMARMEEIAAYFKG